MRALLARVLLAKGEHAEALAEATAAALEDAACPDLELTEGMCALALAEALDAAGKREEARGAIRAGFQRLDAVAGRPRSAGDSSGRAACRTTASARSRSHGRSPATTLATA